MWWQILIAVVSLVALYLLRPRMEPAKPTKPGTIDVPKAKEGEEAGIIYGTMWIEDPQVVWYGDFKSKAIKEKSGGKK